MDPEQQQQGREVEAAAGGLADGSRRRLLRGGSAGAGVLLAVSAKTALGGTVCQSPSAMMSGNTSPRPAGATCSGGLSPGYWVVPQHAGNWTPAGGTFPTFKNITLINCSTNYSNIKSADIQNQGTLLTVAFPGAPTGIGMWYALNNPTDTTTFGTATKGQLLRHLSAAWLNAGYFNTSSQKYPITRSQLTDMWNAVKFGGTYCPTSSCSSPWTADGIITYISNMYDINSTITNVCKK
ncbi:MAG: hypothetical protein KGL51_04555 [Betaproteobacteria bacterium]|nr:hypothetical protein [Betaproteobacteria bacterium]